MTNALRFPAAAPQTAAEFFAAELAFEADPDDVHRDLQAGDTTGYVLVETRAPEAFARARIPGAINLPYRDLPDQLDLDPGLVYICYCESFQCNAATKGALALARRGFRVKRLSGGITAWREAGYPVESDELVGAGVSKVACHC
ncbi:rhodanese-like domain-containing protein [Lentzea sp. BCCO 10_0856]|uniref:Rhodanese-like domain-containing protein n=1 Tax=Lentzea miocenica TaxID=3095431 RepID=A0ABU4TCP3_9PSEU|nr:rhodanese-like domain-containing protein [Lentzea sp. BCCO 10_0856]MDX8035947.1 rhodanese-like domain-containing protein [Lentzea sp. BCCO 10_0856]